MDTLLIERKVCSVCKVEQSVTDFHFRSRAKGERHARCRSCQSAADRRDYVAYGPRKRATTNKFKQNSRPGEVVCSNCHRMRTWARKELEEI